MKTDRSDHFELLPKGSYVLSRQQDGNSILLPSSGEAPIRVSRVDDYSRSAGKFCTGVYDASAGIRNQRTHAVTFF